MKKNSQTYISLLLVAGLFATLASCRKMLDEWNVLYHVPQNRVCDVATYGPGFDTSFNLPFPYYFQKTYSSSGSKLSEISFYFDNLIYPPDLPHQQFLVEDRGRKVLLFDKFNPSELIMTIYLNKDNRVDSFRSTRDLGYPPDTGVPHWNGFTYKNNRLYVVSGFFNNDTCYYDASGNLLSLSHFDEYYQDRLGYFYSYDYTRSASQQYYKFGINYNNGFQLLQYLGYFPELNNPRNLLSHFKYGIEHGYGVDNYDVFDHQFDQDGKLLSFRRGDKNYPNYSPVFTITWNCRFGH